jgi:hypothetical protein
MALEGLASQLRDLEVYFSRYRMQRASVAAGPGILPALIAFITSRTAKPIRFRVQQGVEGLLNRPTNHLAEMIPNPGFINLDNPGPVAFNPLSSFIASILPQFWRKPAVLKARKILYLSYDPRCALFANLS